MTKWKVLIVDDEEKIRSLLNLYLIENEYSVMTASNGKAALEAVESVKPHIIVLDIAMPGMNGFDVCERIREKYCDIFIIYLSGYQETESIIDGLDTGGDDYVTKPFDPNVLIAKINAHVRRTNKKNKKTMNHATEKEPVEKLVFQEKQILQWMEKGYTNKEIAATLKLTEGTVKSYNHVLFQKLQVKNRTQAIIQAKEVNLL